MKKILLVLFLLINLSCFATHFTLGSGSGNISLTSMTGHSSGDTALITPGTYNFCDFENLTGIIFINNNGIVSCLGNWFISKLTNCIFTGNGLPGTTYGFIFTGTSSTSVTCNGGLINTYFQYLFFHDTNQTSFDFNNNRNSYTYIGTTASLYAYRTHFDHCKSIGANQFYQGTFSAPTDFTGVTDSTWFTNLFIDSAFSNGDVFTGSGTYDMYAYNDTILNAGLSEGGDRGVWDISGNVTMYNIYRHGRFGYLIRLIGISLNGRTTSHIYNCADLSTVNYGTIDYRIEPTDTTTGAATPPYIRGSSLLIDNITSGNKGDYTGYTSPLLVLYNYGPSAGYTCELKNSLIFNNQIPYSPVSHIIYVATADQLTDSSNNRYYANPITSNVFVDTVSFQLKSGSPAINAGTTISYFSIDHLGTSRPQSTAWDIGWQEFIFASPTNTNFLKRKHQTILKQLH